MDVIPPLMSVDETSTQTQYTIAWISAVSSSREVSREEETAEIQAKYTTIQMKPNEDYFLCY